MTRRLDNWLKGYQEYSSESEAPETYHLWTGLSVIASAVRRNVWLDQGIYLLYPNIFVILVAPPGKIGKSTVLRMGRQLLFPIDNVTLGPDSVSAEELVRIMSKVDHDGQSAVTIHSSELSSLIDTSGTKMLQILTDLYDCDPNPGGWRRATKTQGKDTIKNPVLNMLAATTPSWIADGFPENVISHGFTARTIFVYEDEPRFANPFPAGPDPDLVESLIEDLKWISGIEGNFKWGIEGRKLYEEYYGEIRAEDPDDYRIEGFHWRKRTHVIKTAMLLSLAQDDELVLRERDIEAAINVLEMVEVNMPRTFSAVGKYDYTSDLERIWARIVKREGMYVSDIVEDNYAVGGEEVKNILTTLRAMSRIEYIERDGGLFAKPIGKAHSLGQVQRAVSQVRGGRAQEEP